MKSVLYCGCTVNAYMPCTPVRLSLSLFSRIQLFRSDSLFLSFSLSSWPVVSSSLFARYLARWAPAQPMKARGGELLRRSYGMAGIAGGVGAAASATFLLFQPPQAPPSRQPPSRYHSTSLLPLLNAAALCLEF